RLATMKTVRRAADEAAYRAVQESQARAADAAAHKAGLLAAEEARRRDEETERLDAEADRLVAEEHAAMQEAPRAEEPARTRARERRKAPRLPGVAQGPGTDADTSPSR